MTTYFAPGQRYHCRRCDIEQTSVAPFPPCWVCGQPTEKGCGMDPTGLTRCVGQAAA